jgi:hypothetical protein
VFDFGIFSEREFGESNVRIREREREREREWREIIIIKKKN